MTKDYYKTLGVEKGTSIEDIRKAFKKLARKYHPDVNPNDKKAEEKFKELAEAYDILSDAKKRKQYDRFGSSSFKGGPSSYTYQYTPSGEANFDLGDIFGDIFGGMGGGVRSRKTRRNYGTDFSGFPEKGKDLHFTISLGFIEAAKGCEKTIRLSNETAFKVKIPEGVETGARIRLSGKGEPGINGGGPGDLYIEPRVEPHHFFRKVGSHIELDVPITIEEALEGSKIKVPTLDGPVELTLQPGSQSGQRLRLKGKGITNLQTKMKGDQYLILQIYIPPKLDGKTIYQIKMLLKDKLSDPRKKFWE
ncbi:MAG: hypothetical protein A3G32_09240 [Deltaproteobacteria bacterium RIFCSPLOWO2_12_FULL_40_28]|nr:MAG: hypothetical protein A3C45_08095 [Deltaproteobacteria bacterium RIFCSPHIGHO2_02_FULL_40_28]OGQ21205.1 MAG: hypothetical protein A3E27_01730 [Deltaproteobacteria bacterium RIFCSPHIGHO2_12_FULL_40_32]OGQ39106.1 MAG: hypothetical protein A3I69_09365 [Deltaproteobacteria bacterium RIFCSPLOWO2_02_FULL_40_36]OGQ53179.1 MAG: hypothetical protein A3G32_09240 [Deltaproteobacteria bacterium RIFCSPLOWO2_12_FULL_40_28]